MTDRYIEELAKSNMLNNYRLFNSSVIPINNDSFSRTYIYDFLNKFVCKYNLTKINLDELVEVIVKGLQGDISANDFYNFVADQCVVKTSYHPEYNKLASKILAERLHKMTEADMLEITNILYNNLDSRGNRFPLLDDRYVDFVNKNADLINTKLDFNKDYDFDYFGLRTLERSYLMRLRSYKKVDKKIIKEDIIIERPQHLFMRVALFIHLGNLEKAFETYDLLSDKYFTHATPTLFNAGSPRPQMSSCYLIACEDSMDSITDTLSDVMQISKWAGGIGVHISSVRGDGSIIRGTNGLSDGILGLCKGLNWASLYVNQGGKRNGSIACFIEDTEILTINEGIKKIKNVKIGDLVVTHKNRVRPVTQLHKNPLDNRKIYKLKVEKTKDIYVTENHKFWSFYTHKNKHIQKSFGWNSINDLKNIMDNKPTKKTACYISIPSSTNIENKNNYKIDVFEYKNIISKENIEITEENNKIIAKTKSIDKNGITKISFNHSINKIWNITEDFANLIGIWLGDGCIRKANKKGKILGINFTVHKDNINEIEFINKVCKEIFNCNITLYNSKISNVVQITVNSRIIGIIFNELFGSYFDGKKLPNMIFNWPINLINNLIAGLITTDGHIKKKKSNITLGLSNQHLMNQLYHLCRNNGIDVSLVKGKITKGMTCEQYSMSIPFIKEIIDRTKKLYYDDRLQKCCEKKNGNSDTFLKILEISETDRHDEYVYTLGVEEDHSYTVEGLLAENCYMEPYHSDIFQFCELRMNTGAEDKRCRDLFLALWIPDLFMERVESDEMWSLMCPDQCPNLNKVYGEEFNKLYEKYERDGKYTSRVSARKLFKHIMTCQSESGFPYMCYKDHANRKSNQKNLGTIRSSNLCVSGDTYILTKEGQLPIKDCVNKNVTVWNGSEWSEVIVKQTGTNQELIRVSLSNGTCLDCTPEHKFYIQESYKSKSKEVPAKDLQTGNKLIKWELPSDVNCNTTEFKYPYTHGFFCGDGTTVDNYSKTLKYPVLTLYGEKKLLIEHIEKTSYSENNANNVIHVTLPKDLEKKFKVPLNNNKNTQLRWLEGFFDADGSVCRNGTNESLQAGSIEKDFLIKIRLMLQTLGIESKVTLLREAEKRLLPDGKGDKKLYDCKPLWRILISSTGLYKLAEMGFAPKRLKFVKREPQGDCEQFVEVLSVTNLPTKQDTYCFTEPLKHMGMFNGILTGQCAEIVEYSDENETAVCNLVSLCLPKYIEYDENNKPTYNFEKLMYVTRVSVRNLNNVIDLNFYPTDKTKVSNLKNRPVGIGVQGSSDVYNMMGYGFDSPEAELLNKKIFECIYYAAVDESKELAKIHGHYQSFNGSPFSEGKLQYHLWGLTEKDLLMNLDWVTLCNEVKQYGTRNSLLTALMPTASTAQIMGNYEGFEPYLTNIFVRTTLAGEFVVINEHLVKDLELLNLWNEDMRKLIIIYNGSIQHIDSIPSEIKMKYKTAFEISLKSIIKQSIERGPFIDQSQSMNLFQPKPNFKVLYTAHMYGWKNGLKTGMYYLRTSPAVNPINFGIDIDDLKRLTGLSSVEELIQNSIADANIITNKRKRTDNSVSSNDDENNKEKQTDNDNDKPLVCRYVRGQAPADCLVCSS